VSELLEYFDNKVQASSHYLQQKLAVIPYSIRRSILSSDSYLLDVEATVEGIN